MAQNETPQPQDDAQTNTTAVRQGVAPGILRYMLAWSLALAVAAIAAVWFFAR